MNLLFLIISVVFPIKKIDTSEHIKSIEVFMSSRDCIRCSAVLNELLGTPDIYSNYNLYIYTDSRALRIKLLNEFDEKLKSDILVNDDLVNIFCNDGYSRIRIRDEKGYKIKLLKEYRSSDIIQTSTSFKKDTTYRFEDDLVYGTNPKLSIYNDNVLILNPILNYFSLISNLSGSPSLKDLKYSVSKESYREYSKEIEDKIGIKHILSFDEAAIMNKEYSLPMFNIASFNLNGESATIFENIYIYYRDSISGDTINRGFVFCTTSLMDTLSLTFLLAQTELIEPFMHNDNMYGQNIFSQSFRIMDSKYFSFVGCYTHSEINSRLENRILGIVYSIEKGKYVINSTISTSDNIEYRIPDDLVSKIPKYLSSNTNHVIKYLDNYYVINTSLKIAYDISSNILSNFGNFLFNLTGISEDEFSDFTAVHIEGNKLYVIFNDGNNKKSILEFNFRTKESTVRVIENYGTYIGSFVYQSEVYVINLSIDKEFVEITKFRF
jgi:hypothetical protein